MNIRQFVEQLVIRQKSFAYDPQRFTSYEKYSTTEQVIGEWIDGKPLYRKTVAVGSMPNNSEKPVSHGISNVEFITSVGGSTRNASGLVLPLPYLSNTQNQDTAISVHVTATTIFITAFSDRSNYTESYITLVYTKTTD